jgi:hypothetical protein
MVSNSCRQMGEKVSGRMVALDDTLIDFETQDNMEVSRIILSRRDLF